MAPVVASVLETDESKAVVIADLASTSCELLLLDMVLNSAMEAAVCELCKGLLLFLSVDIPHLSALNVTSCDCWISGFGLQMGGGDKLKCIFR